MARHVARDGAHLTARRRPRARAIAAALAALASSAAFALAAAGSAAPPQKAAVLTVGSTSDVVDGNVSSAQALAARPGPDGISLREAITAANATPGSGAIYITFASGLAGHTISIQSHLPAVLRNNVTINGPSAAGGEPALTIDARRATRSPSGIDFVLPIQASNVTVRRLRLTGVAWRGTGNAIGVFPGSAAPDYPRGPPSVSNIRIEDNVFDNRGIDNPRGGNKAQGIEIVSTGRPLIGAIANVSVVRNVFLNYTGDAHAVGVVLGGGGNSLTGLVIRENRFEGSDCCAIELGAYGGKNDRVSGTRIVGNAFSGNTEAISLNIGASDTVFDDTLIAGNVIAGSANIPITVGAGNPLGDASPTGNVIRNIRIVNNLLAPGSQNGIWIMGGGGPGTTGNRVEGVELRNNTIVNTSPAELLAVLPDLNGAAGNSITGVVVRNSIFWAPGDNFKGNVTTDVVQYALTTMPGFAGANGNISADPRFVGGSDFRLQAGSPAIDAGTSDAAPTTDIEDRPRFDDPATPNRSGGATAYVDMGAFEFGAPARPRLSALVDEFGGAGTVTSAPAGISCPPDCSAPFDTRTSVALTATPRAGARFTGWSGACSGTAACTLTMDAPRAVTAAFGAVPALSPARGFTVSVVVRGRGRVMSTPAGIACSRRCARTLAAGTLLRLRATPAKGFRFVEWGGRCRGSGNCLLRVNAAGRVVATFRRR